MLEISQEITRNFTPCFSSRMPELVEKVRLSPKELLDISEEIGRDFAPKPSSYNAPELVLLPVDPGHLYAYWHLEGNTQKSASASDNDNKEQLTLRVYSQPDEQKADAEAAVWFDVAIDSSIAHQQVALPTAVEDTAYSAAIGKCCADDSFIEFVHSNIVHAPHGQTAWHYDATYCSGNSASGRGISKRA
ncbi:DUF4912 domain-containing protein [Methylobacter sp.]|uniref:DUF4912 domain-containing protein n=1 Tax=Methylobacter sp. TaxID=2051955 RepID=UPI0025E5FD86|nr:DUF4912 domain-containing protein [Methylobacter sp.]